MGTVETDLGASWAFEDALRKVRDAHLDSVTTLFEELSKMRRLNGKTAREVLDALLVAEDRVLALKMLARKLGATEQEIDACVRGC